MLAQRIRGFSHYALRVYDLTHPSSYSWVISDADPNRPATGYYTQPSPSVAPVLPFAVWNATYLDGSGGSGNTVVVDTVTSPSSGLSIPGQSIELANNVAQASSGAVGMLGLGFSRSLDGSKIGNSGEIIPHIRSGPSFRALMN